MIKHFLAFWLMVGCGLKAAEPTLPPDMPPATNVVVLLGWDPSPDTNLVMGYKVYYGTNSRVYPWVVNAGTNLTCAVSNLTRGAWYFFAATAYTASGLESYYSVELAHQMVAPVDRVVRVVARVESSADLWSWAPTNIVLWEGTNPSGTRFWKFSGMTIESGSSTALR